LRDLFVFELGRSADFVGLELERVDATIFGFRAEGSTALFELLEFYLPERLVFMGDFLEAGLGRRRYLPVFAVCRSSLI
jgi:hypothetical protein